MNLRLSPKGFLVDHVLGWAVQFGEADADSGADGAGRGSYGAALDGQAVSGGENKDSRSMGLRFPYSG
jgi:hypothetical protein